MTLVKTAAPRGLRVILCMAFNQHAPFNELAELKRWLIANDRILHSVEVSGSFDFMIEAAHDNLADYQEMVDEMADRFGHLIDHHEANFVCRRYVREETGPARHLWVPTASGFQRLDHGRIDKVTAEGDYVRVHSGAANWLVHMTMRTLLEQLDPERFLQLSRSLIVRADFIDRLLHDYRRWTARLLDGTDHSIAKSRCSTIIARLKVDSSMSKDGSSIPAALTDGRGKVVEKSVH